MAQNPRVVRPRTYFLNETHELSRVEREARANAPKYAPIDWEEKGTVLASSIRAVRRSLDRKEDPVKEHRYFLLAKPEAALRKLSTNVKKAPEGVYDETPEFAGKHSQVFRRLGIDLIHVHEDGTATVHAKPEKLEQMLRSTSKLATSGRLEQARWASVAAFAEVPPTLRFDVEWLETLHPDSAADTVIELHPLLTRSEVDAVGRTVSKYLRREADEGLRSTGTDFSGRTWFRGKMRPQVIPALAESLFSIQSIHPPLYSFAAARSRTHKQHTDRPVATLRTLNADDLPCVGVVDTGIPEDHVLLRSYVRGRYREPQSAGTALGDHGSRVASRVVFGDVDFDEGLPDEQPIGDCAFYDVTVSVTAADIFDEAVVPALETVVRTAPDVRVFNLSFDTGPLDKLGETERRERLINVQDLDNFAFKNDVLIVIAAGNTRPGVIPATPYPHHYSDGTWALGAWARAFNALTCGATVERLNSEGLAGKVGAPSPFSRVGPGFCGTTKPDFGAHGGDVGHDYRARPGLGVWTVNAGGLWEDSIGTSFAAPLVAREAAKAFKMLQGVCEQGARPYAVTVRAFLHLTGDASRRSEVGDDLFDRALGRGYASSRRLTQPVRSSAVLLWQGVLSDEKDLARVQVPVPISWWQEAQQPRLRLVACYDPPVNAAALDVWACRSLSVRLRLAPDGAALHSAKVRHKCATCTERDYDLSKLPGGEVIENDQMLVEMFYGQAADYSSALDFAPEQRVALAVELYDGSDERLSPQAYVQALSIASSMTRLTIPASVLRTPIQIKARI